jgi:hypothetical protein
VSYNSEGLLSASLIKSILAEHAGDGRVRQFTRGYKRYRADRDRVGRTYSADRVRELLYHIERPAPGDGVDRRRGPQSGAAATGG